MAFRKIILIGILMLTGLCYGQQRPVLYAGFDYYRDKGFDANAYGNLNAGMQVYQWKMFAPEIGVDYYFGGLRERSQLHPTEPQARAPRKSDGRFDAVLFSLAPKLVFGNRDAALVLIPRYHFGSLKASGDFLVDAGDRYELKDEVNTTESISFWSIAAGVQGDFFETDRVFFSLFLKYQFLDTESSFEAIEDAGTPSLNSGSVGGLGIGFKVYVDIFGNLL